MSQKTTSSPDSKPSSSVNKSSSSPVAKSTLVNASGKGIRSSSSSSSGTNTKISNAYTAEKSKSKIRSNSGQEKTASEQSSNISTSPNLSETPAQPSTVSGKNKPDTTDQTVNANEDTKSKKEKSLKAPRKISNIETSRTERISDQSLKRANSYASSCKPNNPKSSPNIAEVHSTKPSLQVGKTDKSDVQADFLQVLKSIPVTNDSRTKSTVRDSGFIDSNNGISVEDTTTSGLQRPASFHGAGRKQAVNPNTSPLNSNKPPASNERRKSCYAGTANEISTADLFSEHRDDSGFPRLSWKGEHTNPDLDDEGKKYYVILFYLF